MLLECYQKRSSTYPHNFYTWTQAKASHKSSAWNLLLLFKQVKRLPRPKIWTLSLLGFPLRLILTQQVFEIYAKFILSSSECKFGFTLFSAVVFFHLTVLGSSQLLKLKSQTGQCQEITHLSFVYPANHIQHCGYWRTPCWQSRDFLLTPSLKVCLQSERIITSRSCQNFYSIRLKLI